MYACKPEDSRRAVPAKGRIMSLLPWRSRVPIGVLRTVSLAIVSLAIVPPVILSLVIVVLGGAPQARAQPIADFYRGKTLSLLVGVGVGGEFDLVTRLLAKYIGRHIPGNPSTVTQNMVGASGMKVLNYLYNQAPRDGTAIVLVQPALPAAQAVGLPGVQYAAEKLNWLGTIAPAVETLVVWHTSGVKTIEDARERDIVIGATAKGSNTYGFPAMMKEFLGARFKIVTGYASGTQINLAMERGEVDGRDNSWASWKATKPDWVKEHKITVLARFGPFVPDLAAPALTDMVENADERRIVELVLSGGQLGRPFAAPPGVPPERVTALRAAFDAVMQDPDFLGEAAALNLDVAPIGGEALQRIVEQVVSTPKDVASRARHFLE
jgi:tripartite-type tricarboxylate transporter receptor subunit TctC